MAIPHTFGPFLGQTCRPPSLPPAPSICSGSCFLRLRSSISGSANLLAADLEAEGQFQCGELEQAAYLLKKCLPHARGLHSFLNMQRIQALYKRLKVSPAGQTQAIVELANQLGTDFPE